MRKFTLFCCVVCSLPLIDVVRAEEEAYQENDQEFWNKEVKPFLNNFCIDCHSGDEAEAGIDFEKYESPELLTKQRPRWNQVRGMIEIGAMPPVDYDPQPTKEERESVSGWIDRRINYVDCDVPHDPGRVTLQRLNNTEYDNTLRDLLGIDFSVSSQAGFPSDGVGNGFDNQGDVLSLSPLQIEKYMRAAQLVTTHILASDHDSLREQEKDIPALFATDRGSVNFLFADGTYEVRARLNFEKNNGSQTVPVALLVDGQEVARWDVGTRRKTFAIDHDFQRGQHQLTLHFVEDPNSKEKAYRRRIEIDYVGITGPTEGDPELPEPYRRLFTSLPTESKSVEDAAREIFTPLVRRAYRTEPETSDISRVVGLVTMATEQGESFESAVGYGLQSVLVSPKFLFRVENEPTTDAQDGLESLSGYALASRLSYFLWSSMPDDPLLDLASQGKLTNPDVLKNQARRMMEDPRSQALVSRFFGQYLGLDNLDVVTPDPNSFPFWNDALRDSMRNETELFCQEIIDQDLPIDVLLQGDFTFVNPRLAEFYGIDFDGMDPTEMYFNGPGYGRDRNRDRRDLRYQNGERWIRVPVPENRRGVLTHAAVLTLTSNPTDTSPVKRGKWILENIFGDPPPPAPPTVPSFEATKEEHGDLSMRRQLEIHRENPSCASCHRVMDPLGLGFEHFDAVGGWRMKERNHPIDATGQLADGRQFQVAIELLDLLKSQKREISRHFAGKLLTYGLGRGLEPYDNCAVDLILDHAESLDLRFSAFIEAIVVSEPFRRRTAIPVKKLVESQQP